MTNCVILLTACVNPNGMPLTKLSDSSLRAQQYYDAIQFYLSSTTIPIVFAENSNAKFNIPESDRFEMLCFDGNKDKTHGKGYGECEIIEYAINHSRLITKNSTIIKITGRLIINNINLIISQTRLMKSRVICSMHSDFSFADSRYFSCPYSFLKSFVSLKEQMNDSRGIYFETILANVLNENKNLYFPSIIEPEIIGFSGSTGEEYSLTKRKLKDKIRYIRFQLSLYSRFHKKKD